MVERARLRASLPETPRFVEVHALLRDAPNLLIDETTTPPSYVVWEDDEGSAAVVGSPPAASIQRAAEQSEELLAFEETLDHVIASLPGWASEEATIWTLEGMPAGAPGHSTRWLATGEVAALGHLDEDLAEELLDVEFRAIPILAALNGGLPVAFAYAASESDRFWDMSIDTVAAHRRQGFAQAAARALIRERAADGKVPVWGSAASNPPSAELATKLGYVAVDKLWVFTEGAALADASA